jgi:hypothetical protein
MQPLENEKTSYQKDGEKQIPEVHQGFVISNNKSESVAGEITKQAEIEECGQPDRYAFD